MIRFEKLSASLPQPAYDAKQVQTNEPAVAKQCQLSLFELMTRAGASALACIQQYYPTAKRIWVFCGKGNNGGDGLVLARLALEQGCQVSVFVMAEAAQIRGDAQLALQQLQTVAAVQIRYIASLEVLHQQQWLSQPQPNVIVDALLGTGFQGELRKLLATTITFINQQTAAIISLDIPSGLSADTGQVTSVAVHADCCITFVAIKRGLLTGKAADHVGTLYLADLGVGAVFHQQVSSELVVQGERAVPRLPKRLKTAHKGNTGLVLTIGGRQGLPGAIRLASEAALRCGAGLVAVACAPNNQAMVLAGRPELMLVEIEPQQLVQSTVFDKAGVLVIGPGLGRDQAAMALLSAVLAQHKTMIVDADALMLLAQLPIHKPRHNWILTPHPGEAASLLGCEIADIEADRFAAVQKIVQQYGGICVLKGAGSLISDGQSCYINTSGNAGMASGGMGDVLSGIIAALLLQMPNGFEAVRLAVYLHGKSADVVAAQRGERGLLASDLLLPLQMLINQSES